MKTPIITLTTDFGTKDNYAGSMKGAILGINPAAKIVDITHEISSYDINQGAFQIGTSYFLYPKGTIHVGVVDPGVGSARLPILIKTNNYSFIGPDNGLFTMIALCEKIEAIYHLKESRYFLSEVSQTFHGRDLFAPVAAYAAKGVPPDKFGPLCKDFKKLPAFELKQSKNKIQGTIIDIDKFGNATTNISHLLFQKKAAKKKFALTIKNHRFKKLSATYSDVSKGKPVLISGSRHYLEMGLNQDSLAKKWRLKVGNKIDLRIKS